MKLSFTSCYTTLAPFLKISASVWEANLFVAIFPLRGWQT
jgi:hypothetical protein